MNLGERLTKLRKSKGLSQEQLAEELYLTRQTISKWELNQSTPDIDYLVKLSDYFCVTTDYLIKGKLPNDISNLDIENSELSDAECVQAFSNSNNWYKWCIYLGGIIMGVCLIGVILFVICSALNPWSVLIDNISYDGLLGFLFVTKTLWLFIILSVLFVVACLVTAYGIVKSLKNKK